MTDNNGSYIKAPEDNKSNIQTMTPWGKAHAEKEAQKKAAPQKQTSNEAGEAESRARTQRQRQSHCPLQ